MYEELISDLRYCADKGKSCGLCKHYEDGLLCLDNMLMQAADAIDKLSYHADDWERIADHWWKKYEELEQLSYHANNWEKIADHWRKKYEELERQMREKI